MATAEDRADGSAFGACARSAAALVALVSLASLALQYWLLLALTRDTIGPALATLRFVSYFTILSNMMVVLATGSLALQVRGAVARWWTRAPVLAAIALYIGVTGAIYVLVLRHLWQPQGAQWWADSGLHYATPALYLLWWLLAAPHGALNWRDAARWLLFPAGYLVWSLLRGAWLHEYPYPFIDVDALGMPTVLRNAAGMVLVFAMGAVVAWAIDGVMGRRRAHLR